MKYFSDDTKNWKDCIILLLCGKLAWLVLKKYRCPRCNYPVDNEDGKCVNCGQLIKRVERVEVKGMYTVTVKTLGFDEKTKTTKTVKIDTYTVPTKNGVEEIYAFMDKRFKR